MIAPDGAHLPRPAVGDDEVALDRAVQHLALGIDDLRQHAGQRQRGRAGLQRHRAGDRCDHMAAGLGLPPGIDDRAAPLAHHLVIPFPGFRVDRLADRAQHAQGRAVGLLHPFVAFTHQRAQRGRRGVEGRDLVLVDDLPEAAEIGIVGDALVHQRGRAVGERAIDDIAVPRDPAHVRSAPEHLALAIIENVLVGVGRPEQIAAAGVEHALGLAGRAAGIEDEQRVLRPHRLGRAVGGGGVDQIAIPLVAAVLHRYVHAAMADDDDMVDRNAVMPQRGVDIGLERHRLAPATAAIRGDHDARIAIDDPVGEAFGRETSEYDRMDRADPRTGQHREGRLGDHRQIDGDAVALGDAQPL